MGEIFFVLKTLLITVVVVTCLQIRLGPKTVEQHSLAWMHRSVAIEALRGVADGAVAAVENGYVWTRIMISKQMGKMGSHQKSSWDVEAQHRSGDEVD